MSRVGRVEISGEALRHNLRALKSLAPPGMQVAAVVKANAYGHGLEQVVPILEPLVHAFQVDDLDELRALRKLTSKRAFVFGYVPNPEIPEAVHLGGELCIYDPVAVEAYAHLPKATVHLKVDALLGRLGVLPEGLEPLLRRLEVAPNLEIATAYAHYGNIEDTTDPHHAIRQEQVFNTAFERIREVFPSIGRHLSATSGLMTRESPLSRNDWVRLGIGLYGLYPSGPLSVSHSDLELRPVMRWTSALAQVKELPAGHPVGYGLTYVTSSRTRIGIVPQGYSDGYDRGLSGLGEVLVRGKRCSVLGRVAMNMFAIDLTPLPEAQIGDELVLLGPQGDGRITAEELADKLGTINYEIVARINPLLKRDVVD